MKQGLLGSTALAVIGLVATDAMAADGVKLGIGGWYNAAAGVVPAEDFSASSGVDEGDFRDYVFKQNVAVAFTGESTLDNGLTVGAYVELRGQTQSDQIRKVYAYFSGDFGKVQFGDQDSALATMCYLVPTASKIFGADSPAVYGFNFSNAGIAGYGATNGTCYGIDSYSTQLVYFSPVFAGFQFGLSFTPDQTEDTRNTVAGGANRVMLIPDGRCSHATVVGARLFVSLKMRLEAKILVLRQQINVWQRKSPKRIVFSNVDRLVFVGLYHLVPGIVDALRVGAASNCLVRDCACGKACVRRLRAIAAAERVH
jgi:Gram-negative porin